MGSDREEQYRGQTDSGVRFWSLQPKDRVRPLVLTTSVTRGVTHWIHLRGQGLAAFRQAILARDFGICQFCGFRSGKYQEVLTQNGADWSAQSVFTACIFCTQCVMLEIVPSHRSGVLIRLPEMSQVALNRLMPALYTLRLNQGTSADKARRLLTFFMGRRQGAVEQLTSDEPSFLAEKMSRCATAEELCELRAKVEDIRLLPLDRKVIKEGGLEFNQFPQILAYWRSKGGPLGNLRYDGQLPLLDSVLNGFGLWPPEESVMDEPPPPFR